MSGSVAVYLHCWCICLCYLHFAPESAEDGEQRYDICANRGWEAALSDRKVDQACIQETQLKGNGCKFYGASGKIYKLFWTGGEERLVSVGIFISEKWVDSVIMSKGTVKEY